MCILADCINLTFLDFADQFMELYNTMPTQNVKI